MVTDSMTIGLTGTFSKGPRVRVATDSMASTTSCPETTRPKTAYPTPSLARSRSSILLSVVLMKN